jgi:hypothetical protein
MAFQLSNSFSLYASPRTYDELDLVDFNKLVFKISVTNGDIAINTTIDETINPKAASKNFSMLTCASVKNMKMVNIKENIFSKNQYDTFKSPLMSHKKEIDFISVQFVDQKDVIKKPSKTRKNNHTKKDVSATKRQPSSTNERPALSQYVQKFR